MSTDLVGVKERSAIDTMLLGNAKKSLSEISRLTGIPVADVSERLSVLLEDRGWRTDRQEERLLLIELEDLIEDSKQKLKDAQMSDYASIGRLVMSQMKFMMERIDNRRKLLDADLNQLTVNNARAFGSAYDIALSHVVKGLMMLHPEITLDEAQTLSREGLMLAKTELDKSVTL